ncbi:MAG: hypothetical protein ACTSO9_16435 [Candidatus Helarchaeota archaeon]
MDDSNSPKNLIQEIQFFLENIDAFYGLLNNKIGQISNFFKFEIDKLNSKYFNIIDFSTIRNKFLHKKGINKNSIYEKIKISDRAESFKNDRQLLIKSYYKSLELAKLLEIYSNLCINIFIKNYSFEDIIHAKTNVIMKKIYERLEVEKKILIT